MDVKTVVIFLSFAIFVNAQIQQHHYVIRSTADVNDNNTTDDEWWKTAIFYQIYPRSFMDSNADGIGDLQGIISRLDHLKDMGITAAWLSPIFKSPGVDQGYDISDYRSIDTIFGNLTDLRQLIAKAREMGIKIILDFVPNHTSDEHDWFVQSQKKNGTFSDYYIWVNGTKDTLPNNWLSVFGGPAWTWSDARQQWYFHQFASAQPDLNYENPEVVQAMKDVLTFWLDFGVDGFRIDAVPFLFEDPDLKNEPLSGAAGVDSTQYAYLKHIYTTNQDKTYDLIYQFRALLDAYNKNQNYSRIMMTEAYTDTAEQTMLYYGNSTTNGAHFTFNFIFLNQMTADLNSDKILTATNLWLSHLDKKYVSNWVLGNHDQHRVATRYGVENIDAINMLTAFLPGVQVTYNGEEIGMENGNVTCAQGYDPQAIKNCSTFAETSRDFERTPFQWDNTTNAGFSTASETWLPVSDKYLECNLKAQNVPGLISHYNVYKDMVAFRENFKNITYDYLSLIKLSENVIQIVRKTSNGEFVYIFNTGINKEELFIFIDNQEFELAVASSNSNRTAGDNVANPVALQPYESIVLKSKNSRSGSNVITSGWLSSLFFLIVLVKFY